MILLGFLEKIRIRHYLDKESEIEAEHLQFVNFNRYGEIGLFRNGEKRLNYSSNIFPQIEAGQYDLVQLLVTDKEKRAYCLLKKRFENAEDQKQSSTYLNVTEFDTRKAYSFDLKLTSRQSKQTPLNQNSPLKFYIPLNKFPLNNFPLTIFP
jgi:hypothetical protein